MKRIIALTLVLIIFFASTAFCSELTDTKDYLLKTVENPCIAQVGGEWTVLGLARCGLEIPEEYFEKYYENVKSTVTEKNGSLHQRKYTEYSRVIIALSAIGKNPENVEGYNLVEPLNDFEKTNLQGLNGAIFALIAIDTKGYKCLQRERYIEKIISSQNADGGFSLSNSDSDVDITAMALTALSKYVKRENVKTAVNGGLEFLKNAEITTCEGAAQTVVALCSLGISPTGAEFNNPYAKMMNYYLGGGFCHSLNETKIDILATEQGFYALCALKRYEEGKNALYNMNLTKDELISEIQNNLKKYKINVRSGYEK